MIRSSRLLMFLVIFVLSIGLLVSADKKKDVKKKKKKSEFKKYSEVVTKKAKTRKGVFTTHLVDGKLYYEIPKKELNKLFLWVTQLSKVQTGYGYSGTPNGSRVVRWERRDKNVLLREIKYRLQAKKGSSEEIAVKASSIPSIIGSYKIVTFNKSKDPVIDVTPLFKADVPEFSPKRRLNAVAMDKKRTFINAAKAFPMNIETKVLATFKPKPPKKRSFFSRPGTTVTVEINHSMVKLPEKPMMPRFMDKRVGYFGHRYEDYSGKDQKVDRIGVVHRFRLEKKNPEAKISEPVKPIVFYVGRGVPEKYKSYVKQGIEDWQEAFEQAGFKNAIIGKYAPTKEEDPDWDAEDARYSTIRWMPSVIENAMGPHVADPRSGETIEADVQIFHNVLKLARDWFYVQSSPLVSEAQKLPLPHDLMGKLLRFIVCHEVGHSIGLRHNFKASAQVSIKQIRDPEFTKKYGHTPSIMDYARFNYVAQPGDGAAYIPKIGPYDRFAIEWGYSQFNNVKSPKEEKKYLNKIAARQLTDPLVRFGFGREAGMIGAADHTAQTEDLSSDAIEATRLGMKNLERVAGYIVKGTSKEGEDYSELKNMYRAMLGQYMREVGHVANLVGGVEIHNRVYGMKGEVYTPIDKKRQKKAVEFLNDNCFHIPEFFVKEDIIDRIGMHNITRQISRVQQRVLRSLLAFYRINRMSDIEAVSSKVYSPGELMDDLTDGIFSEYKSSKKKTDIFRRNLQRNYVEILAKAITKKSLSGELRSNARFTLYKLMNRLQKFKSEDSHTYDLYSKIRAALEAKAGLSNK